MIGEGLFKSHGRVVKSAAAGGVRGAAGVGERVLVWGSVSPTVR